MDGLKGMQGNFWRIGNVCSLDRADGFTLMCIYKKLIKLYFLNMCHVYHNFSSKEQVSFNFMAAITICSDFGAPKNKVSHCFPLFPHLFAMK